MKNRFIDFKLFKYLDWATVLLLFGIASIGIIAVANATSATFTGEEASISDVVAKLDTNTIKLQIYWFLIGLVAMIFVTIPDYHAMGDFFKWIYAINIILLIVVFMASSETRGIQGWFRFGERGFQPSEIAKLAIIITLSKVVSDITQDKGRVSTLRQIIPILIYFAIPFVLIVIQPDMGTASVYVFILLGILIVSNTSFKLLGVLFIIGALAVFVVIISGFLEAYQVSRLLAFFNPELAEEGAKYNLEQSMIAIGSGRFTGKGLFSPGNMSQLNYVPEKHTDFIFSVTIEAIGFLGGLLLIGLYMGVIFRSLYLATRAKDHFGTYIIIGVVSMFMFHIFENMGMTMGAMPITGIPLPMISYGGSNMLTTMTAFGLVLNVGMRSQRRSER
jgi:rod shape determining protein RodA